MGLEKEVLLIDDSDEALVLYSMALKMEGYTTTTFTSALEALEYLRTSANLPSLVMVDLSMPLMSGGEFIAKVREDTKLRNLKIVVTSGWDDLKNRAEKLGADGFLRKPFELDQMYKTIHRHLNSTAPQNISLNL